MTAPDSLTPLTESYLDLCWHFDPVEGSGAGVTRHDARLGSFGTDAVRQHVAALRALQGALEELDLGELDDEIDRTALLNDARVRTHRFTQERPHERNPAYWVDHALEGLYQMLVARDRSPEHRARAARERMRAVPGFLQQARATLRDCPRPFIDTGRAVAMAGRSLVDEVALALPSSADGNFLAAARDDARAALDDFAAHLAALAATAPATGYAVGEDAFNFRLHFQHAVRATAPEVLRYGLQLIDEVERELATLADAIVPGLPWPDVVDRLRDDHLPPEGVVKGYAAEVERARAFVEERSLVRLVEGPLEVAPTPAYLRPVIPLAAYLPPGPLSTDRTGRFFVSPPNGTDEERHAGLREHCVHEIAATALHEGYPGHHLHFLTAQAQARLPRRVLYSPITVEGWALYCEDMMGEEGFFRTPEERFFQRVGLLWRATRVVLDVGLHTGSLSYEKGIGVMRERLHLSPVHAEAEVRRTCAEPAYQLAYALGRRELKELREAYRAARGADYTLRGFHEAALRYGGFPVSLMRWGLGLDG